MTLGACSPCAPPVDDAPVVILVSWDTTRADALGCYRDLEHWGADLPAALRPAPKTPVADALCREGLRFDWALAHAPTTLNSHATIFTGLDPHQHAVPRNGFPLPEGLPTLATRFADAGWDTIGIVGASVLEAEMGLSRGFRVYDDRTPRRVRRRYERSAEEVVDAALERLDAREAGRPLFLFVHFFDAHSPWESDPAAHGLGDPSYAGPVDGGSASLERLVRQTREGRASEEDRVAARRWYLAEVARMDAALGRLLAAVEARKTGDRLIVLVGDHGEALGRPALRPYGHGMDVDLEVVHVPLILHGSGGLAVAPGEVSAPVGLSSLAPTVAQLVGLPALGQGPPLLTVGGAPVQPGAVVLAEATKPTEFERADAWNNLDFEAGAAGAGHWYTRSPWEGSTQLQPLAADSRPLPADHPAWAAAVPGLAQALDRWGQDPPPHRTENLSPETRAALEALGYLEPVAP